MGDWKSVDNLPTGTIERSGFESEVKWMVFKVKQRAKTDYFAQIGGGGGPNASKISQIPQYSYNWPYDFCSIIEMASIEPEIEFGVDEVKLREAVQSKLADEAADWLGGDLSSVAGGVTAGGSLAIATQAPVDMSTPSFDGAGDSDDPYAGTGGALDRETITDYFDTGEGEAETKQFEQLGPGGAPSELGSGPDAGGGEGSFGPDDQ
jgi:hypothetical protein